MEKREASVRGVHDRFKSSIPLQFSINVLKPASVIPEHARSSMNRRVARELPFANAVIPTSVICLLAKAHLLREVSSDSWTRVSSVVSSLSVLIDSSFG